MVRDEECDVPDERREQVERLRKVGRLELVEAPRAATVVAEPSGNEAPADVDTSSAAPAALSEEETAAALQAELDALENGEPPPPAPKRNPFICVCGKKYEEHANGKTKIDDSFCGGIKKFAKRAPAEPAP